MDPHSLDPIGILLSKLQAITPEIREKHQPSTPRKSSDDFLGTLHPALQNAYFVLKQQSLDLSEIAHSIILGTSDQAGKILNLAEAGATRKEVERRTNPSALDTQLDRYKLVYDEYARLRKIFDSLVMYAFPVKKGEGFPEIRKHFDVIRVRRRNKDEEPLPPPKFQESLGMTAILGMVFRKKN